MNVLLDSLSGILMIISYVPYVASILRKQSKPVRATWIVWATLDFLLLAGMYNDNALNSQILAASISSIVLMLLSIFFGKPGWTKIDVICLLGGFIGIAFWGITTNPLNAIIIAGIVSLIAAIPTYRSAWEDPSREDRWAWLIAFASCIVYLPVLPPLPLWLDNLEQVIQPLVFTFIESVIFYLLWIRPIWVNRSSKVAAISNP